MGDKESMANLSIRNLEEGAYEGLKKRALGHGVSMEEEARQIIYKVLDKPESISALFIRNFGLKNGIDLESLINGNRHPHEPMSFDE
ncbi:MAG: hypothetical protein WCK42_06415 [Myxococcaceae bacterium]